MKNIITLILVFSVISFGFTSNGTSPENSSPLTVKPLGLTKLKPIEYHLGGDVVVTEKADYPTSDNKTVAKNEMALNAFDFPELDAQLNDLVDGNIYIDESAATVNNFVGFVGDIAQGNLAEQLTKAREVVCHARNVGNIIGSLTADNLVDMPLIMTQSLGNVDVELIFNTAKIHPEFAEIEVYIRMVVPQKEVTESNPSGSACDGGGGGNDDAGKTVLYFGAQNIYFAEGVGIINGTVGLLADYAIQLGDDDDPKAAIWLQKMIKGEQIAGQDTPTKLDDNFNYSGCYVNFDCDGFKEMGIGGRVFFSRDWIIPTDEYGVPVTAADPKDLSSTPRVRADIQLIAQDWSDIMLTVNMSSPFTLTQWDKMAFAIGNANLDMSATRNPTTVPADHPNIQAMGVAWEGVYIETLSIALPKPFKRNSGSFAGGNGNEPPEMDRIKISANDMLIDALGVSGDFTVEGQQPLIGGAIMDGEWGWSLDMVGISLINSNVNGFEFSGQMGVPILSKDGPIDYFGSLQDIGSNMEQYHFSATIPTSNKGIPVWNAATVTFGDIELSVSNPNDEFVPAVKFTSVNFAIGNPNDYAENEGGSAVKLPQVTLTNMRISTEPGNKFSVEGVAFENIGDLSKVMNFPVGVELNSLGTNPNNEDELIFDFGLTINLTSQEDNGVTATGDLSVIGEYTKDINGARHWEFKKLKFNGAQVIINMSNVYAKGTLCMFEDDEIYGRGFSASVDMELIGENLDDPGIDDGKFNVQLMAIFGTTEGYRYFLVDGFVGGLHVPIYPLPTPAEVLYFTGFGGGVFHNMRPDAYVGDDPPSANICPVATSTSGIRYRPTKETKLGIQFATSFAMKGGLMSGKLTCIIRFSQSMALQNVSFWGVADIMPPSALTGAVQNVLDAAQVAKVADSKDKIKKDAKAEAEAPTAEGGIKARVGLSFDFEEAFAFHGFAEATIRFVADGKTILTGIGSIDILADPNVNRFHMYLGGYYNQDPANGAVVTVPDFFSGEPMTLAPVSVTINYDGFYVSANMYLLTGNDIPGPPPIPAEVVSFFDLNGGENNRDLLSCSFGNEPRSAAKGTGLAFGAHAFFSFKKKKKGFFGSCFPGYEVKIKGGFGFDISLLKYPEGAMCPTADNSPMGLNGFRAGGLVYVFIDLDGKHVICFPLPPLGLGLMIRFDVPNPSYFQVVAIIKVGKKFKFNLELGKECGQPCMTGVDMPEG